MNLNINNKKILIHLTNDKCIIYSNNSEKINNQANQLISQLNEKENTTSLSLSISQSNEFNNKNNLNLEKKDILISFDSIICSDKKSQQLFSSSNKTLELSKKLNFENSNSNLKTTANTNLNCKSNNDLKIINNNLINKNVNNNIKQLSQFHIFDNKNQNLKNNQQKNFCFLNLDLNKIKINNNVSSSISKNKNIKNNLLYDKNNFHIKENNPSFINNFNNIKKKDFIKNFIQKIKLKNNNKSKSNCKENKKKIIEKKQLKRAISHHYQKLEISYQKSGIESNDLKNTNNKNKIENKFINNNHHN